MAKYKWIILFGWFWIAFSPIGNHNAKYIGPYDSKSGCQIWLGSGLYQHDANKQIIGNGFIYPEGTIFPPPIVLGDGCYKVKTKGQSQGWYFLDYPDIGIGIKVLSCSKYKKTEDVKGSGCFFIGVTNYE